MKITYWWKIRKAGGMNPSDFKLITANRHYSFKEIEEKYKGWNVIDHSSEIKN